jgi:hypothetical protein
MLPNNKKKILENQCLADVRASTEAELKTVCGVALGRVN